MNFAVVGTNFITDWMLDAGKLCPEFSLVAVYSRTMERAKEYAGRYGAKYVFDKLEDVCECEEVDAVYVASPISLHAEQSIKFMEAGKHVLCEKPIASNSGELEKMLMCASRNHVVLLEAMRPQFSPMLAKIESLLKSLGTIRYANINFCQYSSRYDRFLAGEDVNTFNPKFSNGALMDLGCYCIHLMLRLFGTPQKIESRKVVLSNGYDAAGVILADYDGMTAVLNYSKVSDTQGFSEIQGEKGTLQLRQPSHLKEVYLTKRGGIAERISSDAVEQDMLYELQAFIDLVKNPEGISIHNKYSLEVMRIMDEVRRQCGIVFAADS